MAVGVVSVAAGVRVARSGSAGPDAPAAISRTMTAPQTIHDRFPISKVKVEAAAPGMRPY